MNQEKRIEELLDERDELLMLKTDLIEALEAISESGSLRKAEQIAKAALDNTKAGAE